ncbi:gephyrin-like molybdotransferase Glp [Microvirga guangxiensis]|uniref:Molybdopterin molybdenumtransferase n=1 Tax=Microvirga guangxiensis TaxID=549386 RepID=A0A1G5JX51_9HYPH|nr:gephyrin-like molybdotransferase Glp [Microvirga guangxiensis]SCY92906.1 molybdopterin molybdochelatase [Microvirga guangxiensis]
MNAHVPAADACSEGPSLVDIDTACARAAAYADPIAETETVAVHGAGGRTLAEDVSAGVAMPAFDQSAMDGYAVALGDTMLPAGTRLPVVGRIPAGEAAVPLSPGHAVRVFTGAPLPAEADAVLMQEHGWRDGDDLVLHRMLRSGDNIRRRGEDIERGDSLLSWGVRLDARHVALLSAQGRSAVAVLRRPRVAVISTGSELIQPGSSLVGPSVYDSNRPMVMTLAAQAGLDVVDGGWVRDDPDALAAILQEVSTQCDLVVTTGGASVGEEDHSAPAVARAGGACETLRIALKPGKPAVVGRIGAAAYLGLPGNPVAALVSWLILGGAVVAALEGRPFRRRPGCPMPAASRFERRPGRTEFAPGRLVGDGGSPAVEILGRGGSARLRPLVEADGLVEIHPLHAPVEAGDVILFHPFRDGFAV